MGEVNIRKLCLGKAGNRDPLDSLYIIRCQIYIYYIIWLFVYAIVSSLMASLIAFVKSSVILLTLNLQQ